MPTPPLSRSRLSLLAIGSLLLLALPSAALAASHGARSGRPAATTTSGPAFTTYAAPAGRAQDAGEPSVGLDPVSGGAMFQAGTETDRVTFSGASATWTDATPVTSLTTLDPILFTDNRTGRTFASQLLAACSATSFSDDGGRHWTPSQGCGFGTTSDHQTVGGGAYPAGGVARPLTAYPDAVYYCAQQDLYASCARSDTGGLTFGPAVPIYNAVTDGCAGLHGHLRVAPDGTVYVPNFDCNGHAAVSVSRDAGTTWTVHPVPFSTTQDESDPSVSIGRDGTVYLAWQDGADNTKGSTVKVAVSSDHGATWRLVYTAPGIGNIQFPEMITGDAGRAAVAFVGSTTGGNDQLKAFPGVFDLYTATTYDGGATWTTVDTTPGNPVQRGGISLGGFDPTGSAGAQRNLLDFNDITLDTVGRVVVGYADGCTGGCVTNPAQNTYTAVGTIARQTSGKTLFAAYDALGGAATTRG